MTADARAFSTYPWQHAQWRARVDVVDAPSSSPARLRAVLAAARSHPVLVLNGFARADMAAAALVARLRRPPLVVVLDPTWKTGTSLPDRLVTRTSVRLLDGRHVHYGVLSDFETGTFPRTWRVDASRVHAVLWSCTLSAAELAAPRSTGGGVFAGGNSLRDWDLLLDAAARVDAPVRIASAALSPAQTARASANVTLGPVGQQEYDALLRAADVVVVPMEARPDRSSGQGTILAAMALGKPLVVNDAPGVRDYVEDGVTGVVVPRTDPGALADALERLLADPEARAGIGAAAEAEVQRRFLPTHYADRVLGLLDRLQA